jgi:lysozyme
MVYTGARFAKTYLGKQLAPWPLWIAHYGATTPMANSTWDKWSLFQYTSSGAVKGINGNVDINSMEKAFYDQYTKPPAAEKVEYSMEKVSVYVNGESLVNGLYDDKAGVTYVPVRSVAESLGASVKWDNKAKRVDLTKK